MQSVTSVVPATDVEVPVGQEMHWDRLDAPGVDKYVFRGQSEHVSELEEVEYEPGLQIEQIDAPDDEKKPGLQEVQSVDVFEPLTGDAVPTAQDMQAILLWPVSSLYVPLGHGWQARVILEAPGITPYMPEGHASHATALFCSE